jgi:hypothetical protein
MTGDLQHLPVNWIDGMKISKKHFEETGKYIEEQLRDTSSLPLTDYNFGILPGERSLDVNIFCDFNQQINVELNSCKAVTPNGSRIRVIPQEAIRTSTNFKDITARFGLQVSQAQSIFIVLSIDLFQRIPAGEPVMEENPPRHPYTKPELRLDLLPAEALNTAEIRGSLVIGKITYLNGELLVQKDFIPSCTAMNSLPLLIDWHSRFRTALESWEQYCIKIMQKMNSKTQSQQPNALANSIHELSKKMLEQLVKQKIHFQWILGKSAPIYLCVSLLENLQYLHTIQQCYPEKEREEMLNYFAEWTESPAGAIGNQTLRVLQISYNHYDTDAVLSEIYNLYQSYIQIFQKLSQLEFIGKRKGQGIFVIEQEVKETKTGSPPVQKPNSRWSPLT